MPCDFDKSVDRRNTHSIGSIIAGPMDGDKEDILYADVELEKCVYNHYVHDFGGYYNPTDVFRLFVNDAEGELVTRVPSAEAFFRPEKIFAGANDSGNENLAAYEKAATEFAVEKPDTIAAIIQAVGTGVGLSGAIRYTIMQAKESEEQRTCRGERRF